MISIVPSLLALAAAFSGAAEPASPGLQFELTTLSGRRQTGGLTELSSDSATLMVAGKPAKVPLSEVLDIRATGSKASAASDSRRPELTLTDGSHLFFTGLRMNERGAQVETPNFGPFMLPQSAVASIRLSAIEPQIADSWRDLAARELTKDMLVIRKGNVLDHLDGTVGAIDDVGIHFVIDGEDVTLKREKIFGVVYARRNVDAGKPVCEVTSAGGDFVKVQNAQWSAGKLKAGILGGAQITIPGEQILSLDFSLGKVRYLSQLEPREVKYTPFFDQVWTYYRDRPRDGGMLRLGNKEYARGLWIHSRTLLKYRLNGEYRRFQAVMGIDQAVAPLGNVHVVISGDDKVLHQSDVRGSDPPVNLDLDLAGVRELQILVDFGGDLDIADHLDLADAKVIK
jgi:NPCBM/NEW2 domain